MESELIKRARAVMQKISDAASDEAPPMPIEEHASVVSAQAVIAQHDEADVIQIVSVWRRLFGFSESREHIEKNLRELRRWQEGPRGSRG